LVINSISTCFGHFYAHHQEVRLRSTACSCLSCCSSCDAGESGGQMCAHYTHLILPDSPASQQLQQDMMGIKMPETCWDTTDYQ